MIIHTQNEQLAALLAPYSLRTPDDDHAFVMAPATVQQLDRLCTVMTQKHAGQWSVSFDGKPANRSYEDLTENVDGEHWQAMMLAPGYIGADTEDFLYWLEEIYSQPVNNDNYKRVVQLFRFWFALEHPDEYHNPPATPPAKYALLDLAHPGNKAAKSKRQRERRTQAARRLGFDSIDQLAAALTAASDETIAAIASTLHKS